MRITMRARPGASHSHQGVACLFRSLLSCDTCVADWFAWIVGRWIGKRCLLPIAGIVLAGWRWSRTADIAARNCRGKRRLLGAGWPIGDSGCRFWLGERDGRYGLPRGSLSRVYTAFACYLVKPSKTMRIG